MISGLVILTWRYGVVCAMQNHFMFDRVSSFNQEIVYGLWYSPKMMGIPHKMARFIKKWLDNNWR